MCVCPPSEGKRRTALACHQGYGCVFRTRTQHRGTRTRFLLAPFFSPGPVHFLQLLAADVARDEGIILDVADETIPIWSPFDSFELEESRTRFGIFHFVGGDHGWGSLE